MGYFKNARMHALAATVAGTALLMGAGSASAVTMGAIPGGGSNEGLETIYGLGTTSVGGWYGGSLAVEGSDGTATVTAAFHGSEASFDNSFTLGTETAMTTGGGTSPVGVFNLVPIDTRTISNVADGLLSFSFGYPSGSVVNGANPDGSGASSPPNFFITFAACGGEMAFAGSCVDLWFDDGGAGPDDNHDDMMVRLSIEGGNFRVPEVPVPASVPLLLSGLAGIGLVARRKAKKKA